LISWLHKAQLLEPENADFQGVQLLPPTSQIGPEMLIDMVSMRMPFGKYQGSILCYLPEPYLVWFSRKGFTKGKLGMLLSALYEIKLNGLEYLLKPIRKDQH
jgi:uncharacterized protein